MASRLSLHALFKSIPGVADAYFQPPSSTTMQYPCIRYVRSDIDQDSADNVVYRTMTRYQVTVIDRNPDSTIVDVIKQMPLCIYDRSYTADNLNHDVFNLYY